MQNIKKIHSLVLVIALACIACTGGNRVTAVASASDVNEKKDDLGTQSPATTVQSFTAVEGADLMSKLAAAQERGRAKSTPYWSAYSFDVRPGIAVDLNVRDFNGTINSSGDTSVLIGTNNGVTLETRNLAVFLLRDPKANQITRIEIYNLERKREYGGYPVYWMGRANNEESLNYLKAISAAAPLDMLSERSVLAIALHDDSRVGGMLRAFVSSSPNQKIRYSAIYWLGYVGGEQQFLAGMVRNESEDQKLRKAAAHSIGKGRDNGMVAVLQSLYREVKDVEVRRSVISAAGNSNDEQAAWPFLLSITKNDADPESRRVAVRNLGHFERPDTVDEVMKIYSADSNVEVKRSALRAMVETKSPKALPRLLELARTEPNVELRKQAVRVVAERGEEAVDDLLRLYASEQDLEVKRNILRSLGDTRSPRALARLKEMARSESNVELRKQAIRVVGERGEEAVDDLLSLYASEPDSDVKRNILRSLADTRSPRALARLSELARSESNVELRKQAIRVVGERGEGAVEDLLRLYDGEKNADVKRSILQSLSESKNARVEDKFFAVAQSDESPELRRQAIRLLGERVSQKSLEFLGATAQSNSPDVEVQLQAVRAISERPQTESVPLLIKIARTHANQSVKRQAIRSLGESRDPRAIEYFREVLSK